jgi:hypothetical protein
MGAVAISWRTNKLLELVVQIPPLRIHGLDQRDLLP